MATPDNRQVTLVRMFDAPRALVFKVWTDPKLLAAWWGPHHFDAPLCKVDLRAGGAIRIDMRGPDGNVFPMTGTYREVVPPSKLVYVAQAAFKPDEPPKFEILNTVIFEEIGGKTKLTIHAQVLWADPEVDNSIAGMEEGWSQSLEKLGTLLGELQ